MFDCSGVLIKHVWSSCADWRAACALSLVQAHWSGVTRTRKAKQCCGRERSVLLRLLLVGSADGVLVLVVGGASSMGGWSAVVVVRDSPLVLVSLGSLLGLGVVGLDWLGSTMAWLDRRRLGLRGWGRQWRVGGGSDVECDRRCGSSL